MTRNYFLFLCRNVEGFSRKRLTYVKRVKFVFPFGKCISERVLEVQHISQHWNILHLLLLLFNVLSVCWTIAFKCFIFIGSINYSQTCLKKAESISLPECSKYYLQLNNLVFDREYDNCLTEYQDAQGLIKTLCDVGDKSDVCNFNLSEVIKKEPRCFKLNRLLVEYTCEGNV